MQYLYCSLKLKMCQFTTGTVTFADALDLIRLIQSCMTSLTGIKSDTVDVTTSNMLVNKITNIYLFVCVCFLVFSAYTNLYMIVYYVIM